MAIWSYPIVSSIAAMLVAQILKIPIQRWKAKCWNWKPLFQTGGMPSSHSAMVSSLAVKMGVLFGWGSPWFAISSIFAIVVMYDASGVRRQAGELAVILNECLQGTKESGLTLTSTAATKLRHWKKQGHTPLEVLGGLFLGTFIAFIT